MKNCQQFREKRDELLTNSLSDSERTDFLAHLESCPECRSHFQQLLEDFEQFRKMSNHDKIDSPNHFAKDVIRLSHSRRRKKKILMISTILFSLLSVIMWQKLHTPQESVRRLWSAENISAAVNKRYPLVINDRVVALKGRYDSLRVVCFDLMTGKEFWASKIEVLNSLAVDGKFVYAWCIENKEYFLIALNLESGQQVWRSRAVELINPFRLPEMTVGGGSVFWSYDDQLVCVGPDTILRRKVGKGKLSVPIFSDDKIVITDGNIVYQVSTKDGTELSKWSLPTIKGISAQPLLYLHERCVVIGRRLYTGQADVVCVDLDDGNQLWRRWEQNLVQIMANSEHFCLRSDNISVLDFSGETVWQRDTGGCSFVALADHNLYAINDKESGDILVFNFLSGKAIKKIRLGSGSCNGIVIKNGTAFLRTHDSHLITITNLR